MIKPMNYIANIHFFNELHFVQIWYFQMAGYAGRDASVEIIPPLF